MPSMLCRHLANMERRLALYERYALKAYKVCVKRTTQIMTTRNQAEPQFFKEPFLRSHNEFISF